MLTNRQKALIAQAKRQAQLADAEYRDALETVAGFRSSTDARWSDRQCDKLLGYLEAIYWLKVDKGELTHDPKPHDPFQEREFWARRNTIEETSRDRFNRAQVTAAISDLERALNEIGYGCDYCHAIQLNVTEGREDLRSLHAYRAVLERTLKSKQDELGVARA